MGPSERAGCTGIDDGQRTRGDAEDRREDDLQLRTTRSDSVRKNSVEFALSKAGNLELDRTTEP